MKPFRHINQITHIFWKYMNTDRIFELRNWKFIVQKSILNILMCLSVCLYYLCVRVCLNVWFSMYLFGGVVPLTYRRLRTLCALKSSRLKSLYKPGILMFCHWNIGKWTGLITFQRSQHIRMYICIFISAYVCAHTHFICEMFLFVKW